MSKQPSDNGYDPGHPWYYKLGGPVQKLKQIGDHVRKRSYRGYRTNEIEKIQDKAEPQRSAMLRAFRSDVFRDLRCDVRCYRQLSRQLCQHREQHGPVCHASLSGELHMSVSLKYSHIYNDLGHLLYLDELLTHQPDLFDV